jgi:hypothetical protein
MSTSLTHEGNPARFSAVVGGVSGGGLPLFNAEDGAIGSSPSKANFLSQLQRALQDKGLAPAKLYGFEPNAPQPWYRPDLAASPDAQAASWSDYVDGVNLGTYRGGLLGLLVGGGLMLAGLYFGGAMVNSPKPAPEAAKPAVATSRHRRSSRSHRRR